MADNPLVPEVMPMHDFTSGELEKIRDYEEDGRPGLAALDDVDLARAMELYIAGMTYIEISKILHKPKVVLMYLSKRHNWFDMKMEIIEQAHNNMKEQIQDAKIQSNTFLLKVAYAFRKSMSKKVDKYLATDNPQFLEEFDFRHLDKYLKIIETLGHGNDPKQAPAGVNINLTGAMSVSKAEDGSVDFTSKAKTLAEKLIEKAVKLRALEKSSDIEELKKSEGDSNES